MSVRKRDIVLVAVGVGAFLGGRSLRGEPEIHYERVEVPVEVILEREPDTVVTFVERIRYVNVPPAQVAVATGGAVEAVQEFCKPVVVTQSETDTVVVRPTLLLRSVSVDKAWWTGKDAVLFTGLVSTGDLVASDYNLRGSWNARANADSLIVLQSRGSWVSGAMEFVIPFLAGAALSKAFD